MREFRRGEEHLWSDQAPRKLLAIQFEQSQHQCSPCVLIASGDMHTNLVDVGRLQRCEADEVSKRYHPSVEHLTPGRGGPCLDTPDRVNGETRLKRRRGECWASYEL